MHRNTILLIAVLSFSIAIRLVTVFLPHIENDEVIYQTLAEKITKNFWDYSLRGTQILNQLPKAQYDYPIFRHPPLFIWFIALARMIFGAQFQILIPIVFGALIIWITFLIAKKLYSDKEGLISGVILCFCPILYFVSGKIWVETLFTFLTTLSFYLLILAADKRKIIWFVVSGLVFGLSLLAKYTSLGVLPAFIYYIARKKFPIKALFPFSMSFLMAASFIILPWIFYYYKIMGINTYMNQFKPTPEYLNMFPFCKMAMERPFYFYFTIPFLVAPIYLFSLISSYIFIKDKEDLTLPIWAFSFLLGFTLLGTCKILGYVVRYIVPATPPLAILAARFISGRNKIVLTLAIVLLAYGFFIGILNTLIFQMADIFPISYFMKLL